MIYSKCTSEKIFKKNSNYDTYQSKYKKNSEDPNVIEIQ